jgi:ABC-type xylose transport system permease subunit
MSDEKGNGNSAIEKSNYSLNAQVRNESLEFLKSAMKSDDPAIVKCALKMAERSQRNQYRKTLKLHPNVVVVLATCLGFLAVAGCWYAFTTYLTGVAWELTGCIFAVVLILVVLYALLAGVITEDTFKDIVKEVWSWVASHIPTNSEEKIQEEDKEKISQ